MEPFSFPEPMIGIAGETCIFCGEDKEHLHHFPPRSFVRGGFLLPCCSNCNTLAANLYPFNLLEQLFYLRDQLAKKLANLKEMDAGEWKIEKLQERLAWNAEENFQKFEIGRTTVLLPVARELLEKSKSLNFDLSGVWFLPAKWNPKLLPKHIPVVEEKPDPPHFEVMHSICKEFKLNGAPIREKMLYLILMRTIQPFQVKSAIKELLQEELIAFTYTGEGRLFYLGDRANLMDYLT